MPRTSTDRRVPRTRALLQQALSTLIQRKRYERITIDDICEAANVGRSTFYAHYESKDDLKRSGLESLRKSLIDEQRATSASARGRAEQSLGFSLRILEHARDHLHHYRVLAGSRGASVAIAKVRETVLDLVREEFAARAQGNSCDTAVHEVTVQYVVGAYMAVLTWWLDAGAKLPAQRIDSIFRSLTSDGVVQLRLTG